MLGFSRGEGSVFEESIARVRALTEGVELTSRFAVFYSFMEFSYVPELMSATDDVGQWFGEDVSGHEISVGWGMRA